jgi:hypothetical protein
MPLLCASSRASGSLSRALLLLYSQDETWRRYKGHTSTRSVWSTPDGRVLFKQRHFTASKVDPHHSDNELLSTAQSLIGDRVASCDIVRRSVAVASKNVPYVRVQSGSERKHLINPACYASRNILRPFPRINSVWRRVREIVIVSRNYSRRKFWN